MRVLMIVDIQESFSGEFDFNYLLRVNEYLEINYHLYNRIVTLLEPDFEEPSNHFTSICRPYLRYPTFLSKHLTDYPLLKMYSDLHTYGIVASNFSATQDMTKDYYAFTTMLSRCPDTLFPIGEGRGFGVSLTNTDNVQSRPYVTHITYELDTFLRSIPEGTTVDLLGGGLQECIYITSLILRLYKLVPVILTDYCYQIRGGTELCNNVEYSTVDVGNFNDYKNM